MKLQINKAIYFVFVSCSSLAIAASCSSRSHSALTKFYGIPDDKNFRKRLIDGVPADLNNFMNDTTGRYVDVQKFAGAPMIMIGSIRSPYTYPAFLGQLGDSQYFIYYCVRFGIFQIDTWNSPDFEVKGLRKGDEVDFLKYEVYDCRDGRRNRSYCKIPGTEWEFSVADDGTVDEFFRIGRPGTPVIDQIMIDNE